MFHFVRNRRWVVSVILVLVAISIVFWGLGAYLSSSKKEAPVLSFANHEMSLPQVKQLIHAQQNAYRQVLGNAFDPSAFLTESMVFPIIDRFIDQQLINDQIYSQSTLSISDEWLARFITSLPDYQDKGHFSRDKYLALLKKNGLTPAQFEADVRRKLLAYQFSVGTLGTTFVSQKIGDHMVSLLLEQRHIAALRFAASAYLAQATVTEPELRHYYDQHTRDFLVPDVVSFQYIVLSLQEYEKALKITEKDKLAYYEAHKHDFLIPEKRHLYSILFFVPQQATVVERDKVYRQALSVLEQLKRNPSLFSGFARQYSADANAKEKAGDQSWVTRQEIEDAPWGEAIFSAQPRTFFIQKTALGYQLSTVKRIEKSHFSPYAEVSSRIDQLLRQHNAEQAFPALATHFSDASDDNPRDLSVLAKTFALPIRTATGIKKGVQPALPLFKQSQFLSAIFASSFVSGELNSPVIEVQPNVYVVAHLLHFDPAHVQAFEQVKALIRSQIKHEKAMTLAQSAAEKASAHLSPGHPGSASLAWSRPMVISRELRMKLTPEELKVIFALPTDQTYPVYSSPVKTPEGYVIFKLTNVSHPVLSASDTHIQKLVTDLVQSQKNYEFMALLGYWRHHANTSVHYSDIARALSLKP